MQTRRLWGLRTGALAAVLFAVTLLVGGTALAQTSSSNNYQMVESQFGNASSNESCSTQYCATVSIGNDSQTSPVSTPEFGEADYSEPLLEMIVISGGSNLGDLSTEKTGTKTMEVKIRNYLTGGYRLQIIGDAPQYKNRSLYALATPTASNPGTEQFGINVVANTTPEVGKNPVLQPGGGDGTGLILENYNTPNLFMYVSGQTVAETTTNTGGADFTISMIVNISNSTPAGQYSGDFAAVVMPYF